MANPLAWLEGELQTLEDLGLRRRLVARATQQGPEIEIDGQTLLNFGSNDYLGLAGEGLTSAILERLPVTGWGSGASPLITGRASLHAELERRIAQFEGTEAALLFTSGFAANCGSIAALAGKGDVILSDAKNHASIIDGCRLSGARVVVYPHRDVSYVEMMLRQAASFRRRLIVTDTLFSMDGDIAPLADLARLAEEFDAMLMVDEAHATGVFGEHGRGITEHLGLEQQVHIRMGTLSKALGSIGGFVAGSQPLIDWLANRARPYVFSTAAPEVTAAAGIRALEIVEQRPERRRTLLARATSLRERLSRDGWNIGSSTSQIVPIFIGEPDETMRMAAALRQQGLFVPGIRPPTVPAGESLLRISLSYLHTDEMLDRLVDGLRSVLRG